MNQPASNSSYIKFLKKESANVQTNTDPWCPECRMCIEREKSSQFKVAPTVDVNEYVKALNYINSIHGLINQSILNNGDSDISLKSNFSMPDLPNFLFVLSSLCSMNRDSHANNCCQMVSKATSTSSLLIDTIQINTTYDCQIDNQNIDTNSEDNYQICDDAWDNQDNCISVRRKSVLQINEKGLLQINPDPEEYGTPTYAPIADELLVPDSIHHNLIQNELDTIITISQGPSCYTLDHSKINEHSDIHNRRISSINNDTQQSDIATQAKSRTRSKHSQCESLADRQCNQITRLVTNCETTRQRTNSDKSKSSGQSSLSKSRTDAIKKTTDNFNRLITQANYEKKDKSYCILSEANLNRYAKSLLVRPPMMTPFKTTPIPMIGEVICKPQIAENTHLDKPKIKRNCGEQTQPEPTRRKLLQKIKEPPPRSKKESIPDSPTNRSNVSKSSKANSCESTASSTVPKYKKRGALKKSLHMARALVDTNIEATLPKDEFLQEDAWNKEKPLVTRSPQMTLHFQLPSLTNLRAKRKSKPSPRSAETDTSIPNTLSLPNQCLLASSQSKKIKQFKMLKPNSLYNVQEKGKAKLLFPKKNLKCLLRRKRSSDSVILTDRSESPAKCTDSDIVDDVDEGHKKKTKQKKTSRNNLQSIEDSFSQFDENNEQELIPLGRSRRVIRNKQPFRQARKVWNDNEEIMTISKCMSQQKCKQSSDNMSHASHTTASSEMEYNHREFKGRPIT